MTPKPIFIRIDGVDAACIAAIRSHLGYITTLSASQTDAIKYALRRTAESLPDYPEQYRYQEGHPKLSATQPEGHKHDRQPHAAQDDPQQYQPPE